MITRIREVRKAKGMTLDDVARACDPPTTPQTVGRLETGMRTVSVAWLNRIADALGVDASVLVAGEKEDSGQLPVAALLSASGAAAPTKRRICLVPRPSGSEMALLVTGSVGDYRAGDEIWCAPLDDDDWAKALNRDVLVPRPAGRFIFGRLIGREAGKLHLLALGAGARQQVIADPPWIAVATRLVRSL